MTIVRCSIHGVQLHIVREVECEAVDVDPCIECVRDGYMEGHEDGKAIGKVESINIIEKSYDEDLEEIRERKSDVPTE